MAKDDRSKPSKWWREDATPKDRADAVSRTLGRIIDAQNYRRDSFKRYLRMYSSQPMAGFGMQIDQLPFAPRSSLALNVTKSCVDTFAATLTKEKPKVMFQTSGGDWDLQKKAKDLTKFVSGQFQESKIYDKNPLFALHCAVWGAGIYKPYIDWGDAKDEDGEPAIKVDLVIPSELHVDDQEGQYGLPRNVYQTKWIDREVLAAAFPKKRAVIENAQRVSDKKIASIDIDTTSDQLLVIEAWHLPPNGRHVICLYNGTSLVDEEWKRKRFPFVVFRRSPGPVGFWGIGLAKELEGIQLEINVLLQRIQRAHKLLSAGHWLVEANSKVRGEHIDDVIGSILRYTGTPPQLLVGSPMAGEVYQHLWNLYQRAFEITGTSQLQAQGQKPAGLDSGEAIRVYRDTINARGQIAQDNFHAAHLELAEHMIELAREITKEHPEFSARVVSGQSMSRVKFLDVDLKEKEYVLQMFPTNALADDPAMRMAQVQELAQAGWIGEDDAKRLLNFPDLESWSSEQNASHDLVEDIIEDMLYNGTYRGPEPFIDLALAMVQVRSAYLLASRKRAPEAKLQLLRTWMLQAKDMNDKAHAPPPGAGAPPGPAGAGGPPPMPSNGGSPLSPAGAPPMPPGGVQQAA